MGVRDSGQLKPPKLDKGPGAATEDERKAAGWVAQAQYAFDNINKILAEDPKASQPSFINETLGAIPLIGPSIKNRNTSDAKL